MEKKAEHGGWQEMLHGLFQKKNWLFFVGLAGICLIFLSDILFGGREGSTGAARQSTQQAVSAATGVQELETRLTEMLESVQGAGPADKGWTFVTVAGNGGGYPIGWAKLAGQTLKNHYPKGLRR